MTEIGAPKSQLSLGQPINKPLDFAPLRRGGRVAEGAPLLRAYTETYRGFESLPLRQMKRARQGLFHLADMQAGSNPSRGFDKTAGLPFWTRQRPRASEGERQGWRESIPPSPPNEQCGRSPERDRRPAIQPVAAILESRSRIRLYPGWMSCRSRRIH